MLSLIRPYPDPGSDARCSSARSATRLNLPIRARAALGLLIRSAYVTATRGVAGVARFHQTTITTIRDSIDLRRLETRGPYIVGQRFYSVYL